MKHVSHLNSAKEILHQYKGKEPFSQFIKFFFRQDKKYGSTDRKRISHLCYSYFRLGHSLKEMPVEEKILTGIFLCDRSTNELLAYFKPEWNEKIHLELAQKLSFIGYPLIITDIFPWQVELSNEIDHKKFCESFLIQPDLFLRVRPGNEEIVNKKLLAADIGFRQLSDSCIALNNSTKIEEVIVIDKEALVQDYSSQKIGDFFTLLASDSRLLTIWDCCAASGGKSIMAKDKLGDVALTVSDIRESILANLKKRFQEAGIEKYQSFAADLSSAINHRPLANFDLIIADVPCTGSGTWSRSPEALCFFDKNAIDKYCQLQKKIIKNVIPALKKNGKLAYITCSVFKKENEGMVEFILQNFPLRLEKMELLIGYDKKADTMFAASFIAG